jgi:hypothetical protein
VITFEVMNGMTALSHTLLRERRLLELLTYRLETQHHLLASGRARFISLAAREIEEVLDDLGHTELERAVQVSGIAQRLGLPDEPSLEEIVEQAPAPRRTYCDTATRCASPPTKSIADYREPSASRSGLPGEAALVASGRDSGCRQCASEADVRKRQEAPAGVAGRPRLTELGRRARLAGRPGDEARGLQPSLRVPALTSFLR